MAIEHGAAEKIDEQYRSKIELRFFRHSKKESSGHGHQVKLSPEGRMLAKEKSPAEININQAIAFASPRVRAQETAGFVLAGSQDVITGDESLVELKEKLGSFLT